MEALSTAPPTASACLEVVSGPAAGQRLPLDDDLRFGCAETGGGALCGDRWLSREHAAVRRGPTGQFEVEDLGSVEGTSVNGRSVRAPHPLHLGDVIELGSSRMVVRDVADPLPGSTPAATYVAASDSRRVLAAIADSVVEVGIAYVAGHVFSSIVLERGTNVLYAAVGFLVAAQFTYRFLCESLCGQTLGKRLFGIRVVRVDGRALDPNAVLIRTLLLLVDGWLLIGLLTMVVTGRRRRRRLGDLAAGTIVVPASTPHPGFARRDRDRLMLTTPLLWLVTIAVALRLLGPGLQTCRDAGIATALANEGSCLQVFNGVPVVLRVVNAGHKLSLPAFDVAIERTSVRRPSPFRTIVSFKLAVANSGASPLTFGADRDSVQLWVPSSDGATAPVPEDAPPRVERTQRLTAASEVAWVNFTIPSEAVASLTDPPSGLAFVTGDSAHPYVGEIRLWRLAGAGGQATLDGLTR